MDLSQFIIAGYIAGAHGIRGEIILVSKINDDGIIDDCLESEFIFHKDGKLKTVVVDAIREHKDALLLKSNDITTRNQAEEFKGWSWIVDKSHFVSKPNETIFLQEIEGFSVVDSRLGELGPVVGFSNTGTQDLIEVSYKGKTVSIPLVKAFIVKIDFGFKKIEMNLPEGLLED